MILLNDPWREVERRRRQARLCRILAWIFTSLAWVALGISLGMLFSK